MKTMERALRKVVGAATATGGFFLLAATAFAQSSNNASVSLVNPLSTTSLSGVITNIINFLATDIAVPLCTIMVLVGAFQLMTSAGDPERESRGRKTILYAAIGFAVALLATGVAQLIQNIIQGS